MTPIVWGVLGAARIALKRVIPAMHRSESCDVRAIASRDAGRAAAAAEAMGVPRSWGSYEALLAGPKRELPRGISLPPGPSLAAAIPGAARS